MGLFKNSIYYKKGIILHELQYLQEVKKVKNISIWLIENLEYRTL